MQFIDNYPHTLKKFRQINLHYDLFVKRWFHGIFVKKQLVEITIRYLTKISWDQFISHHCTILI